MILALLVGSGLVGWNRLRRLAMIRRATSGIDSLDYFEAVALELRRGASLRHALAQPSPESRLARLALSGQPLTEVAAELERSLARPDPLIVPGVLLAGSSGAPAAPLFSQLADRARREQQLARDRRSATAQARLSAAVVGVIPIVLGMAALLLGSDRPLAEPGLARTAVFVGIAMQLTGLTVVAMLLRYNR